jgi:membrane dipeptidase
VSEFLVFDAHSDLALGLAKCRERGEQDSLRSYWLPKLRRGNVGVVVCALYIDSIYLPEGALRRAIQLADALLEEVADNSDQIELVRSHEDIQRINADGKVAVLLALEGAEPLGMDLSALRLFHRLGLRMVSFAWMRRTAFGDGTWENDSKGGLTRLGRQAVAEMNRLGIIVDISHASDQTAWDIIEASSAPIVASHSNARALHPHLRNLTDDQIRAVAGGGGVIGAVAVPRFISDSEPTIARWVDHVDYLVEIAGIDHVGIGADFTHHLAEINAFVEVPAWSPDPPTARRQFPQMLGPENFPGLVNELMSRGYSDSNLRKILYENFVRLTSTAMQRA